ncbi:MAG: ribosome-associated translation inhibitor RaiA [Bacteroidetes bacterium]|nr:ribosome-associated translation inhibitor RaiA [Bacteroidota bacterium]
MKVSINSVHFKTDKKLDLFITEKLNKLATIHTDLIGSDVMLKLANTDNPDNKIIEIRLLIKGNDIFAKKQSKSFEEATDLAIDALKKQLKKHKEKLKN